MKDTYMIELLNRFIQNKTSLEEDKELLRMLKDESFHQELLDYCQDKWDRTEHAKGLSAEIQHQMLMNIKKRIRERQPLQENVFIREHRFYFSKWMQYAAVAFIAIVMSWGVTTYYRNEQAGEAEKEFVVFADKGQRASVTLPDGTKVWLNSDSRLTYSDRYGHNERRVSLSGEGYFEVAKDVKHRFVVDAGAMEIEALGTVFNVKAYNDDKDVITTLLEGKVRAAVVTGQSVTLTPNQSMTFDKENCRVKYGDDKDAIYAKAWRDNEIAFDNATLAEMGKIMERSYNIKVDIRSEEIRQCRFSGIIKNNSLNNVFEIISLTAPINYKFVNDTVVLTRRK